MKKKLSFVFALILGISAVFSVKAKNKEVYAASQSGFNLSEQELYNLTNTYPCEIDSESKLAIYNLNEKDTTKKVNKSTPAMTVFTHGLGASAATWSNNNFSDFQYSKDSLITRMSKLIDLNIYLVKVNEESFQLTIEDYTKPFNEKNSELGPETIDKITDNTKHTIVVFQASETATNSTNDAVYAEFNYAISRVVYDLSQLNSGVLPTMNLIGHSRGGITNMQYALDHPDLVDSIFSFGTPYTGSSSAELDYNLLNSSFVGEAAKVGEMAILEKLAPVGQTHSKNHWVLKILDIFTQLSLQKNI